jgi:uncharacterized protein YebE (UPF0316 family)
MNRGKTKMNKKQIENNIRLIANINGCAVEKAIAEIVKYVIYEIESQKQIHHPVVIYEQKNEAKRETRMSNRGVIRMKKIHQERKRLMKIHKNMNYHRAFMKAIKNVDNN